MIRAMLAELDRDCIKDCTNTWLGQLLSNILRANAITSEEIRVLTGLLAVYTESRERNGAEKRVPQDKPGELKEDIWAKEGEAEKLKCRKKLLEEQQALNIRQLILYRSSRARSLRRYLEELEQGKRRGSAPAKKMRR